MEQYIPVIIVLIGGPLVTYITIRAARPKVQADASDTLNRISLSLVEPLEKKIAKQARENKARIEALEVHSGEQDVKIAALERENKELHTWAQILHSQVVEGGGDPIGFDTVQKMGKK
jgi:hypothetical protein